jgi:hypothetical protein
MIVFSTRSALKELLDTRHKTYIKLKTHSNLEENDYTSFQMLYAYLCNPGQKNVSCLIKFWSHFRLNSEQNIPL